MSTISHLCLPQISCRLVTPARTRRSLETRPWVATSERRDERQESQTVTSSTPSDFETFTSSSSLCSRPNTASFGETHGLLSLPAPSRHQVLLGFSRVRPKSWPTVGICPGGGTTPSSHSRLGRLRLSRPT